MRWANRLKWRLRSVFGRSRVERELDAELRFHLDQQIEDNLANGMNLDEARSAASRSLGSVILVKEQCHDSLGLTLIDSLLQDVRYACRWMRRSPLFAASVAATIGLGLGVFTSG